MTSEVLFKMPVAIYLVPAQGPKISLTLILAAKVLFLFFSISSPFKNYFLVSFSSGLRGRAHIGLPRDPQLLKASILNICCGAMIMATGSGQIFLAFFFSFKPATSLIYSISFLFNNNKQISFCSQDESSQITILIATTTIMLFISTLQLPGSPREKHLCVNVIFSICAGLPPIFNVKQ